MTVLLSQAIWFPDPELAGPDEPVAIGGDLSVPRLLAAYRTGLFPWTADPISWWSPDPRAIFELDGFHVPRSLARTLKRRPFEITYDQAFRQVMAGCAAPAPGRRRTWIAPEFIRAYSQLHQAGHAHSVECWQAGQLVGGVYGVQIGGFFAGESMFHRADDGSKVALFHLVERLREQNFALFDIQQVTPTTRALGAVEIPRRAYLRRLRAAVAEVCAFCRPDGGQPGDVSRSAESASAVSFAGRTEAGMRQKPPGASST
jgi:leucyl/phenylalanyl-tRNA---protein transferase